MRAIPHGSINKLLARLFNDLNHSDGIDHDLKSTAKLSATRSAGCCNRMAAVLDVHTAADADTAAAVLAGFLECARDRTLAALSSVPGEPMALGALVPGA